MTGPTITGRETRGKGARENDRFERGVGIGDAGSQRWLVRGAVHDHGVEARLSSRRAQHVADVLRQRLGKLRRLSGDVVALQREKVDLPVGSADAAIRADRDEVDELSHAHRRYPTRASRTTTVGFWSATVPWRFELSRMNLSRDGLGAQTRGRAGLRACVSGAGRSLAKEHETQDVKLVHVVLLGEILDVLLGGRRDAVLREARDELA